MAFINTSFAHGNGPFSRVIDLALAINRELVARGRERMQIIVPLVYGDRQKRIIVEDHGAALEEDPDLILFDEFQGYVLGKLFFKSGNYRENLEFLLSEQQPFEDMLRDGISKGRELETLGGKSVVVEPKDIAFEITHNPRVVTGITPSFYTTIGFFSEILHRSILEDKLDIEIDVLTGVRKIADKIEDAADLHFMPEPFTFSYVPDRKLWKKEIFTPPFIPFPKPDTTKVPEGMYVMVTGIDGLRGLFDAVGEFGMKFYCPPFVKDMPGADNRFGPEFVSNPNIRFQFGRTGWSTVWWSHMSLTPLITSAYVPGDDPEIYFNEKTVQQLGLAVVFDKTMDPREVLKGANNLRVNLIDVNLNLERNYGTLDGINYTAKVIVDRLNGSDISKYSQVKPVFNK